MKLLAYSIFLCCNSCRCVLLEILRQLWFSFHITEKLKLRIHVLMLCLVTGSSGCFGTIRTGIKTIKYVMKDLFIIMIKEGLQCNLVRMCSLCLGGEGGRGEAASLVCPMWGSSPCTVSLRMSARKFPNIDFFLRLLPLKVDELLMSEM